MTKHWSTAVLLTIAGILWISAAEAQNPEHEHYVSPWKESFAKLYPRDARPIRPLNGRVVKESQ